MWLYGYVLAVTNADTFSSSQPNGVSLRTLAAASHRG